MSEPDVSLPAEVARAAERLDELVKRFEEHPDQTIQERVFELLQCVDILHRAGLRRLNDLLKIAGLQQRALDDPEVRLLFDLYDLGEGGERLRVEAVVESLRPSLDALGARLEVLGADATSAEVRLSTAPSCSTAELRRSIEQALRDGVPGVERVTVLEVSTSNGGQNFVPLTRLRLPSWQPALALSELPDGHLHGVRVGKERVLLANLGKAEVVAFVNACPGSPLPLDAGRLREATLRCPWHGCLFDLRTGQRRDGEGPGLDRVAAQTADGRILVRVAP
jgi:nitrite reductase/ring-hydroxylating ferredoxin subunit/Fe-S cluster biogenesis protein NfuA